MSVRQRVLMYLPAGSYLFTVINRPSAAEQIEGENLRCLADSDSSPVVQLMVLFE